MGGDDATAAQAREASATLSAPFDLLFRKMCACFADSPAGGMVVASCDVLLLMPEPPAVVYDWSKPGVTGLAGQMQQHVFGTPVGGMQVVISNSAVSVLYGVFGASPQALQLGHRVNHDSATATYLELQ